MPVCTGLGALSNSLLKPSSLLDKLSVSIVGWTIALSLGRRPATMVLGFDMGLGGTPILVLGLEEGFCGTDVLFR